jgi:competence protein ComEA
LGSVDVNTADAQALEALRGVGPALAQAIVDERTAAGPFDYPEDLTMGKGIGEKTLLKFYDQLDFSARAAGTVLP